MSSETACVRRMCSAAMVHVSRYTSSLHLELMTHQDGNRPTSAYEFPCHGLVQWTGAGSRQNQGETSLRLKSEMKTAAGVGVTAHGRRHGGLVLSCIAVLCRTAEPGLTCL